MTKSKNTKRALLMSALSMMLCIAMLAGSTFAWFTDTVTSGKNRIVAGNLDVELYYMNASTKKDSNNDSTGGWANASKESVENPKFFVDKDGGEIKWESGVMAVTQFKVANVGTLALKYALETLKADFNMLLEVVKDEDGNETEPKYHDLSEVIKFAVIENDKYTEGTTTREDILALNPKPDFKDFTGFTATGDLFPVGKGAGGPSEEIFTVVAYWAPNANEVDNLYNANNKKIAYAYNEETNTYEEKGIEELYINIEISLTATQTPYEEDSFGNDYDVAAPMYPAGVTAESFGQQTVYIWHEQRTMDNIVVNSEGEYFYDVATAIKKTPAGGTLYFKEGAIPYYDTGIYENNPGAYGHYRVEQQSLSLTKSITIYANGVDFSNFTVGGDYNNANKPQFAYAQTETFNIYNNGRIIPEEATVNIKVVNAKNFKIYGKSGAEVANTTYNIIFEGCVNDGVQLYNVTGSQFGCINTTITNCKVSNLPSTSAIGSFRQNGDNVVKNCVFENVGCGVDANMETENGKKSILVEGCKFINCGSTDTSSAWLAPMRIAKTKACEFSVTLKDNTITNTNLADVRGDVVLHWGDNKTYSFNCELTTDNPIMIKTTSGSPVACNSGTIQINGIQ